MFSGLLLENCKLVTYITRNIYQAMKPLYYWEAVVDKSSRQELSSPGLLYVSFIS